MPRLIEDMAQPSLTTANHAWDRRGDPYAEMASAKSQQASAVSELASIYSKEASILSKEASMQAASAASSEAAHGQQRGHKIVIELKWKC